MLVGLINHHCTTMTTYIAILQSKCRIWVISVYHQMVSGSITNVHQSEKCIHKFSIESQGFTEDQDKDSQDH